MNKILSGLKKYSGFTLIEVLVVVGILGVLITLVIVAVNPSRQLQQTRDTQRASDLKSMQTALEASRVANNIYPLSTVDFQITGAPWGGSWAGYLGTVPRDPVASRTYAYVSTDGTNYQLYADFEGTPPSEFACAGGCGPNGLYDGGVASANSVLQSFTVQAVTPTPTPVPLPAGKISYFGSSSSYPKAIQVDFDPLDVANGSQQTLTAKVWSDYPVTSVSAYYVLDGITSQTYQLNQTSAAVGNGIYKDVWSNTITVNGTHDSIYELHLDLVNSNEATASSVILIRE